MEAKMLGGIQLIGALVSGWMSWQNANWETMTLAAVFLITAIHHFTEKNH